MNEEVGWMQDLLQGQDPSGPHALSEYANSAVQIRLQIQRSAEITRRILSWSREGEENRQLVDLNVLLNKTLVLLESDLSSARISVTKELDPRLPPVSGNLPELRQVFLHLTKNALDAMKERGGVLTIATESRGDLVRASIRDTGPGIPKELAKSIFSPFFTTKPAGEGTGIGLSISAWIVKRLGGKIEVESEPGAGSSFHVSLPAYSARPQEENPR
jgi:two-component system NtrC family sensor kinase